MVQQCSGREYNERRRQRTNNDSVDEGEGGTIRESEEMKTRQVWQLGQRYRWQCVFHDTAICRKACQHCHYQAPPLISRVIFLPFFAFAMISHAPRYHVLLTYITIRVSDYISRGIFISTQYPHFRLHARLPLRRCHTIAAETPHAHTIRLCQYTSRVKSLQFISYNVITHKK